MNLKFAEKTGLFFRKLFYLPKNDQEFLEWPWRRFSSLVEVGSPLSVVEKLAHDVLNHRESPERLFINRVVMDEFRAAIVARADSIKKLHLEAKKIPGSALQNFFEITINTPTLPIYVKIEAHQWTEFSQCPGHIIEQCGFFRVVAVQTD